MNERDLQHQHVMGAINTAHLLVVEPIPFL
jgi:hypothetical protein